MPEPSNSPSKSQKKAKDAGHPSSPISIPVIINNRDCIVEIATAILAVVALLQAVLLLYTLNVNRLNTETLIRMNSPFVDFVYMRIKQSVTPIAEYKIENFGGGHAFMRELGRAYQFETTDLPTAPPKYAVFPTELGIGKGADLLDGIDLSAADRSTRNELIDGLTRGKRLFVFGHVIYDDILGQRHTRGYGFELMFNGCIRAGGSAYNYYRTESENSSAEGAGFFSRFWRGWAK